MIVVDTNILVYYYVNSEGTEQAVKVHEADPDWVAPYLWRSEFRNTLLQYLRKQLLNRSQLLLLTGAAEQKMRDHEYHIASDDIFLLAGVSDCSAYDCEFVALARSLGVPLVTADRGILAAFPETAVSPAQFIAEN